ncbi:MAG: RyR domain-containing protein [Coriobacteriales bacterium]|nr:RyR domain-containing protein [Coriobacteriales bacterium]
MINATAKYVSTKPQTAESGIIEDTYGNWRFTYNPAQTPLVSSKRKRIYRGTFESGVQSEVVAACAVAFEPTSMVAFGDECANLGLLTSLGVGPELLAVSQHRFTGTGVAAPVIVERDAGENLAQILRNKAGQHGERPILHAPGTPERELENLKILFDVYAQLHNAHQAGVYHRDLRCENVCVRRFGKRPADIRATVVDFELSAALMVGELVARAPLFGTLFSEIPSHVVGAHCMLEPNPLELDMGYLGALKYHLIRNDLPLNGIRHSADAIDDFLNFLEESVGYFSYSSLAAPPYARHLNQAIDIDPLAKRLGLTPVNETVFASRTLLAHARSYHRPYLDGEDMKACMNGAEARLTEMVDRIVAAKFETYKALRRKQGLEVIYERVEDQPLDLRRSNYAQAEHVPNKVRALGYLLVPEERASEYEEVTSFTDEQIEVLARLEHDRWMRERLEAGWTLDKSSSGGDPEKKTSPYLVPYDRLSERIKEYDRDAVRQLIPLVRSARLMVVRPKP